MRSGISITALTLTAVLGTSAALAADPTGDWQVEGGFANIRVAECGGAMWGVVAWEKKTGNKDVKNPDPAKQSRPTLGMVTLFDMHKKPGADQWDGQVYDAQTTGQKWTAKLMPKAPDGLRIEGCAMGFICSGQDWTRAGPPIPSSPANNPANANAKAGTKIGAPPAAPKPVAAPGQTADIGDICLLPEIKSAIAARGR